MESSVEVRDSSRLASAFDGATASPRLVLLVSPTCPICLEGAELVASALDEPPGSLVDVHVVWLPVLEADDYDAAIVAAARFGGRPRVAHYWDGDRVISSAAFEVLDLGSRNRRIAWDLYLFYPAGQGWVEPMPRPELWLHQLDLADLPSLDETNLHAALEGITARR